MTPTEPLSNYGPTDAAPGPVGRFELTIYNVPADKIDAVGAEAEDALFNAGAETIDASVTRGDITLTITSEIDVPRPCSEAQWDDAFDEAARELQQAIQRAVFEHGINPQEVEQT